MSESYKEMRDRHQAEFNAFADKYMFFAYDDKQFNEGLARFGLTLATPDMKKLVRIESGAYMLRERVPELKADYERRHAELLAACDADLTGEGFLYEMFLWELTDHEYCYTLDPEEAVECTPYTLEEIEADPRLSHALEKAMRRAK